jgi:hypothetical protein
MASENEWLKSAYGPEDEQVLLNDDTSVLGSDTRQFLETQFVDAAPWLRSISETFAGDP